MRFYFLSMLFLFFSNLSFSQLTQKEYARHLSKIEESKNKNKVVLSYNTILKKIKVSTLHFDYKLPSVSGIELICFKKEIFSTGEINVQGIENKKVYFIVNFIQSSNSCEINTHADKLKEFVVENNLVQNNEINTDAEKRVIQIYGNRISQKYNTLNYQAQNNIHSTGNVQRNRNMPICVNGTNILQDNKIIATFFKQQQGVNTGIKKIITLYEVATGNIVAQASVSAVNNHNWEVITFTDRIKHYVKTTIGKDEKNIAEYPVNNYYL